MKRSFAEGIAALACAALLDEVYATPKPGLVDQRNNGAHTDMDTQLFIVSANALRPYFCLAAQMGETDCRMAELREAGISAEADMLTATNGVNTHRGVIYAMGLLTYGMGRANAVGGDAIEHARTLVWEDYESELMRARLQADAHGARQLKLLGARGARGEAANGFPHAVYAAERLRLYRGAGEAHAASLALCDVMTTLEDTNLLHRGGREGLLYVQREADRIRRMPIHMRVDALYRLDEDLISRNLSPGGSADMLALGLLLEQYGAGRA